MRQSSPIDPQPRSSIPLTSPAAPSGPRRRSRAPSAPPIRLHLKPGQKGTQQLLAHYGDRLVCVRYRYDPERQKRLKTVELVVDEHDWSSPRPIFRDEQIAALLIPFADRAVRDLVKGAGGRWDPDRKVWKLRYDQVLALGLQERIVQ